MTDGESTKKAGVRGLCPSAMVNSIGRGPGHKRVGTAKPDGLGIAAVSSLGRYFELECGNDLLRRDVLHHDVSPVRHPPRFRPEPIRRELRRDIIRRDQQSLADCDVPQFEYQYLILLGIRPIHDG